MQAIDSSWEVQQGGKVHREFVGLAFQKQASFEWRNLVTKIKKKKKTSVHQRKKQEIEERIPLKVPFFNGRFNIKYFLRCVCGGDFLGILNQEK